MSEAFTVRSYARHFVESLEGLRAVAAVGVIVTHVAFHTSVDQSSPLGAVFARFDFFVAVFFALSAFLLWRKHRSDHRWGRYYFRRFARIVPGYLVCAVTVLLLLPDAFGASIAQALAQLTLTQIYVPDGLIEGLTHIWSLCVEVAFYLILPLLAEALAPLRSRRHRIAAIGGITAVCMCWPWLPFVAGSFAAGQVNLQIWPPSYAPWFAVGLIAAECEPAMRSAPRWLHGLLAQRWAAWLLALVVAWLAGQEWFGPLGLTHPSPGEFTARILAGTVFAALIVVPYALAPAATDLIATRPLRLAGKWSYSLFLWHVAVLEMIFPLTGMTLFQGGFLPVFTLTLVASLAVAACSYTLVEAPVGRFLIAWWDARRAGRGRSRQSGGDEARQHRPGHERAVSRVEVAGARRPRGSREPRRGDDQRRHRESTARQSGPAGDERGERPRAQPRRPGYGDPRRGDRRRGHPSSHGPIARRR